MVLLRYEADVGTVVEGVEIGVEAFGGLEVGADVQRVDFALLAEAVFAFFQGGAEERVAVGSQDEFPGTEVEGDDADVAAVDGEAVDDAVGNVLLVHGFQHAGDDGGPCRVVAQQLVLRSAGG